MVIMYMWRWRCGDHYETGTDGVGLCVGDVVPLCVCRTGVVPSMLLVGKV